MNEFNNMGNPTTGFAALLSIICFPGPLLPFCFVINPSKTKTREQDKSKHCTFIDLADFENRL